MSICTNDTLSRSEIVSNGVVTRRRGVSISRFRRGWLLVPPTWAFRGWVAGSVGNRCCRCLQISTVLTTAVGCCPFDLVAADGGRWFNVLIIYDTYYYQDHYFQHFVVVVIVIITVIMIHLLFQQGDVLVAVKTMDTRSDGQAGVNGDSTAAQFGVVTRGAALWPNRSLMGPVAQSAESPPPTPAVTTRCCT